MLKQCSHTSLRSPHLLSAQLLKDVHDWAPMKMLRTTVRPRNLIEFTPRSQGRTELLSRTYTLASQPTLTEPEADHVR